MTRGQKAPSDRFSCSPAHLPALLGVLQKLDDSCRTLLDARDQVAVLAVSDLMIDPAYLSAHDRRALPHRLRDHQAEAFAGRLLHDDVATRLESVDLEGVRQVVLAQKVECAENVHVRR